VKQNHIHYKSEHVFGPKLKSEFVDVNYEIQKKKSHRVVKSDNSAKIRPDKVR
jgi:hypothetical protein